MSITLPMFAEALHAATKKHAPQRAFRIRRTKVFIQLLRQRSLSEGPAQCQGQPHRRNCPLHHHPAAVCIFGVVEGHGPIGRGGPHRCKRCIKAIGRRVGIRDLCGHIACQSREDALHLAVVQIGRGFIGQPPHGLIGGGIGRTFRGIALRFRRLRDCIQCKVPLPVVMETLSSAEAVSPAGLNAPKGPLWSVQSRLPCCQKRCTRHRPLPSAHTDLL